MDHSCEVTFIFRNLEQSEYSEAMEMSKVRTRPYVSHSWQTGLETTSQGGVGKAAGFLSATTSECVDT